MIYNSDSVKKDYSQQYSKQRGLNLKRLREEFANQSPATFRKEIGFTKNDLSLLECGEKNLSLFHIHAYRTYFKNNYDLIVSVDYLMGYTDVINNQSMDVAEDLGLSNDSLVSLKYLKNYWDPRVINTLNYIMKDSNTFLDLIDWISIFIDNPYTIPLRINEDGKPEECGYTVNGENGILLGQEMLDNKGNIGYKCKGIGVDILESHAMLKIQEILSSWRRQKKDGD